MAFCRPHVHHKPFKHTERERENDRVRETKLASNARILITTEDRFASDFAGNLFIFLLRVIPIETTIVPPPVTVKLYHEDD
ncbi:hypothetical protein QVD17_25814 [Tagetes erecta]|uniref:Uncharacterized protein n=1 Tax=Tagetes erecta TaxID=13708 RepID=A0AAD8K6B9_TARER|nr:hypothetical protein QVD17_25814 [Tagetes erecta]